MSYSTLSYGSTGEDVKKLQKQLGIEADGIYGSQTQKAVQQYQQDNGLQVDGIAGNETLGHLYGAASNAQQTAPDMTDVTTTPANTAVSDAQKLWEEHLAKQPGAYQSANDLQSAYNQVTSQQPFKYDPAGDAVYQQLIDRYNNQGKMAAMDTIGQAAGLTGGYGSTYGQRVGQQAHQEYLKGAYDQMPEFQKLAMQQHQMENDRLAQNYAMLLEKEQREYGNWQDQQNAWLKERDYLAGRYDAERSWEAQQAKTAYGKQQDSYKNLVNLITTTGYSPSQQELEAAGMSASEAAAYKMYYSNKNSKSGGKSGTTDTTTTGYLASDWISYVQEQMGVEPTGVWDKETANMAKAIFGASSAKDVYQIVGAAPEGDPIKENLTYDDVLSEIKFMVQNASTSSDPKAKQNLSTDMGQYLAYVKKQGWVTNEEYNYLYKHYGPQQWH